jgi:hypothetical protein
VNTPAPDSATKLLDPTLPQARARVGKALRGKSRLDVLLGTGEGGP